MKKILLLCVILLTVSSCGTDYELPQNVSFSSYHDIPNVTQEEIDSIDELRRQHTSFKLNIPYSTELFIDNNGEKRGYVVLLCEWLSELFDIPFEAEIEELGAMLQKLNDAEPCFASLVITEPRQSSYYMTDAMVQRSVQTIRLESNSPVSANTQSVPRYAFLEGTMITELFSDTLEPGSYVEIVAENYKDAYRLLENGEADAFVGHNTMEIAFDAYGSVIAEDFLPLTFIPVGLAAGNEDLAPIISVISKALQGGAYSQLTELYRQGYQDYRKYR